MRKVILAACLVSAALVAGCGHNGKNGADGKAYIAYEWVTNPFYYATNDPGIPSNQVVNHYYYLTTPGTRNYTYQAWDGSVWSGAYTTWINKGSAGEKGGLFTDGVDGKNGADEYFLLTCLSVGSSFSDWNYAYSLDARPNSGSLNEELIKLSNSGISPLPLEQRKGLRGIRK